MRENGRKSVDLWLILGDLIQSQLIAVSLRDSQIMELKPSIWNICWRSTAQPKIWKQTNLPLPLLDLPSPSSVLFSLAGSGDPVHGIQHVTGYSLEPIACWEFSLVQKTSLHCYPRLVNDPGQRKLLGTFTHIQLHILSQTNKCIL